MPMSGTCRPAADRTAPSAEGGTRRQQRDEPAERCVHGRSVGFRLTGIRPEQRGGYLARNAERATGSTCPRASKDPYGRSTNLRHPPFFSRVTGSAAAGRSSLRNWSSMEADRC